MPSMSYCIFQNITVELDQVIDFLENKKELSKDEQEAFETFREQVEVINNMLNI